jgi:hypothetical protein
VTRSQPCVAKGRGKYGPRPGREGEATPLVHAYGDQAKTGKRSIVEGQERPAKGRSVGRRKAVSRLGGNETRKANGN